MPLWLPPGISWYSIRPASAAGARFFDDDAMHRIQSERAAQGVARAV
jgi:hypothetical protein